MKQVKPEVFLISRPEIDWVNMHGSVMEHANFTFDLRHVSRVLTHELVRHRAGCAYSQESLRYVRLTDLPFWIPDWVWDDEPLAAQTLRIIGFMEDYQDWCQNYLDLDHKSFAEKKKFTSFLRRMVGMGVATDIAMTMNIRTLRHVIYMRTALAADEEIRMVFDDVARICLEEFPNLMADFNPNEDREYIPEFLKV